ncbi:hypothetical protein C818_01808 [Lachnospiraceae bacterium MD308]|nr:hypothetical protein C818_01808 [Lachnospiraceae bacterium MD308]
MRNVKLQKVLSIKNQGLNKTNNSLCIFAGRVTICVDSSKIIFKGYAYNTGCRIHFDL